MRNLKADFKDTYFILQESFKKIWRFDKRSIIIILILTLFFSFQSLCVAYFSKLIIDSLTNLLLIPALFYFFAGILLVIIDTIFRMIKTSIDLKIDDQFSLQTENELLLYIEKQELIDKEHPEFREKTTNWSFATTKYLDSFKATLELFQYFLTIVFSFSYIFQSYWIASFIVIIITISRGMLEHKLVGFNVKINKDINLLSREEGYYLSLLVDNENHKELTFFNGYTYFRKKWMSKKNEIIDLKKRSLKINNKISLLSKMLSIVVQLVIFAPLIFFIYQKKFTIGDYVSIGVAIGMIELGLLSFMRTVSTIKENLLHVKDYNILLNSPNDPKVLEKFNFEKEINIKNLSFTYPNRREPALKNINLSIRKGEKVVILGDNAAGKTTLFKLVLGLYKAPNNSIYYDNIPQENLDRENIWKNSGAVFQNFNQLMISIKDNILFGNEKKIIDEEIEKHLDYLGLSKLGNLESGYDTRLGYLSNDSINLSGGQWQRIMLARILSRDVDFYVLDEPTSALDPNTELKIFELLINQSKNKTVIIITHRVGIASKADKVVVMEEGRIIEEDSHRNLLAQKGKYYEMWNKQTELYS